VRSHQLDRALTSFLERASDLLQADLDTGAEIPFELDSHGYSAARTPLYCYRPLTDRFIAERWGALTAVTDFRPAVTALQQYGGLQRYLERAGAVNMPDGRSGPTGVRHPDAESALWLLVCDAFQEQSDFHLRPERVDAALDRLERSALGSPDGTTLLATLHGMTLAAAELALAPGLTLAQPAVVSDLPEDLAPNDAAAAPDRLVVILTSAHDTAEAAAADGRRVLGDLLGSLQLFGDGRVELGDLMWVRIDGGRWRPLALAGAGSPRGPLLVTAAQEDELRAFCNLVSRRTPHANSTAWALRRFQMGCMRRDPLEALTDYLLALRALLDGDGGSRGALAGRLSALCAVPAERAQLADLAARALALEEESIEGRAVADAAAHRLVATIGDHVRALLRDVICGHLGGDLAALADELLLADAGAPAVPLAAAGALDAQPRIIDQRQPASPWGDDAVWTEDDDPTAAHRAVRGDGSGDTQRPGPVRALG
jgi:hypothetical protein